MKMINIETLMVPHVRLAKSVILNLDLVIHGEASAILNLDYRIE